MTVRKILSAVPRTVYAVLAGLLAIGVFLIPTAAGAATGVVYTSPGSPAVRHSTVTTCQYWTTDEGVSAVVVTRGINCSKTASFTIWAPPYYGATFRPDDGHSAFNGYLEQIGEFVNGPGHVPSGTYTRVAYVNNVYTNHQPTTIYKGPGNVHDGAAQAIRSLLTVGAP